MGNEIEARTKSSAAGSGRSGIPVERSAHAEVGGAAEPGGRAEDDSMQASEVATLHNARQIRYLGDGGTSVSGGICCAHLHG